MKTRSDGYMHPDLFSKIRRLEDFNYTIEHKKSSQSNAVLIVISLDSDTHIHWHGNTLGEAIDKAVDQLERLIAEEIGEGDWST